MIHRKYIIALVLGVALAAFAVGASLYQSHVTSNQEQHAAGQRASCLSQIHLP